jgi:hypothetical protein
VTYLRRLSSLYLPLEEPEILHVSVACSCICLFSVYNEGFLYNRLNMSTFKEVDLRAFSHCILLKSTLKFPSTQ